MPFIPFQYKIIWPNLSVFYSVNSILDNKENVTRFWIGLILDLSYNEINNIVGFFSLICGFLSWSSSFETRLSVKFIYLIIVNIWCSFYYIETILKK